jgi:hypothetical protein
LTHSGGEVDRDELRETALGHRDAEETIDADHRDAVVRHHQKAGAGGVGDFADEAAAPVDIGVIAAVGL